MYILIYLILINIFAAAITVYDKARAVKHAWRVKESTLMLISAMGGGIGMLFTMLLIRHKTRHIKFMLGIPLILAVQAAIFVIIWSKYYA